MANYQTVLFHLLGPLAALAYSLICYTWFLAGDKVWKGRRRISVVAAAIQVGGAVSIIVAAQVNRKDLLDYERRGTTGLAVLDLVWCFVADAICCYRGRSDKTSVLEAKSLKDCHKKLLPATSPPFLGFVLLWFCMLVVVNFNILYDDDSELREEGLAKNLEMFLWSSYVLGGTFSCIYMILYDILQGMFFVEIFLEAIPAFIFGLESTIFFALALIEAISSALHFVAAKWPRTDASVNETGEPTPDEAQTP